MAGLGGRERRVASSSIDWNRSGGLVPVVVYDVSTRKVVMLAYANREALEQTIKTGKAHFYSRSRGKLWMKGETSGNTIDVVRVEYDCDSDSLIYYSLPSGPVCHTGKYSCFHNTAADRSLEAMWRLIVEAFKSSSIKVRKGAGGLDKYLYIVNPLTDNIPPPPPELQGLIADYLASKAGQGLSKAVSLEALGLPIASLVAERLGLPLAVVRKRVFPASGWRVEYSSGYESGSHYIYGVDPGDKVVIVDDAVSTGGAVASILRVFEREGVKVDSILASIAKPQYGGVERLESLGYKVWRAVDVYVWSSGRVVLRQPEAGFEEELSVPVEEAL